jgi:cupin fold WbuC family metalloprotein
MAAHIMKIFDAHYFDDLTAQANANPRLRQYRNIHQSYQDICQRLFNAIEPGSYIRPHRHAAEPRDELLIAIRGSMALVMFDDGGVVTKISRFLLRNEPQSETFRLSALLPGRSGTPLLRHVA